MASVKKNGKSSKAKTADKRRKDASPLNGVVPPVDKRFTDGNKAAVGHGRPRKLQDLKELIIETLAEDLTDPQTRRWLATRAQAMVRVGINKNPVPFLEYAFGKVPQHLTVEDVTDKPDSELIAEFSELVDAGRARAGADAGGGTPAARAGAAGTSGEQPA